MLEIVVGGLADPPPAEIRYTICPADRVSGLGFELTPGGAAALITIFVRYNSPIPLPRHTSELAQCSAPLCLLFRFVDYSKLAEGPGRYQLRIALADPVQLALGLALAHHLDSKYGGGWAVEVYSDVWPQFTDVLAAAKALGGVLRIYTSVYDQRALVADRVVMAASSLTYEALAVKRQWAGAPLCRTSVPEPVVEIRDGEVLELLKSIWESGGFLSLKYAQERHGRAVVRASQMGLVKIDALTLTVRITDLGLRALGA